MARAKLYRKGGSFIWENSVAECLEAAVLEAGNWPQLCSCVPS